MRRKHLPGRSWLLLPRAGWLTGGGRPWGLCTFTFQNPLLGRQVGCASFLEHAWGQSPQQSLGTGMPPRGGH